ncbi:MAG: ATP-dependent helicase [Actinomycetota bacterium]|nr:ATP-dependent helicase [Actinomycetota bacterium]
MTSTPASEDTSSLRAWQLRALAEMQSWSEGSFLVSAAPGAGKTRPAVEIARCELEAGNVAGVVVACPTAPLTRQWARAASALGVELAPDAGTPCAPRGFHGVAVTYARIAKAPARWAAALRPGTLVIADEAHHLGEELAWGQSFSRAFASSRRWLLLSGTPFRSDAEPIPGVSYDREGLAEPDVSYTYAEAVQDGVCRPVCFVAYDGALSWRSGDDVIESSFETVLSTREASRRYRTAISTELPDGLLRILREADAKLRTVRAAGHADAGGLVIAADSGHARRVAALLREVTGRAPVVVLHAESRAAAKLAAFTHSRDPWIVAVNMVSEGVDIPRLRVGVYATAAKTPLVFRQIVGRFVRTLPGRTVDPSWLYVPADPVLRDHAATVEQELIHALRRDLGGGEEPELDRLQRAETQCGETPAFVPLSADVAPQMSLFGPPPGAAAVAFSALPAGGLSIPAAPDLAAPVIPAFERRAMLRDERHRLVSEVRRRDGASHREINAWLNRKLGISGVEQATLADLQRSVELLVEKLSPKR